MSAKIFISDVHIKVQGDEPTQLFLRFLEEGQSADVSEIYLVGDIFDSMVGGHVEYLKKYEAIFKQIRLLLEMNKKIIFLEGNHDFHLRRLFEKFEERENLKNKIHYEKDGFMTQTDSNKLIYVTHGDEVELDNNGYIFYKRIVNNRFLDLVTNEIFTFSFIERLSQWASRESRMKNKTRYETPEMQNKIKEKFRLSAEAFTKSLDVDYLVCGHSHVKDHYICQNGTVYLNNGYAPYTKSFLRIDAEGASFKDLI